MGSLGAESFDSLSAFTAGLSDQCVSIEIPLADTTVNVYPFGAFGGDGKGQREEWWKLWIPLEIAVETSFYFAIFFSADGALALTAADLTPSPTKNPFGMVPAKLNQFFIRVPRNKPYGYYRWSGGDVADLVLRGCRYMPPLPPPGV